MMFWRNVWWYDRLFFDYPWAWVYWWANKGIVPVDNYRSTFLGLIGGLAYLPRRLQIHNRPFVHYEWRLKREKKKMFYLVSMRMFWFWGSREFLPIPSSFLLSSISFSFFKVRSHDVAAIKSYWIGPYGRYESANYVSGVFAYWGWIVIICISIGQRSSFNYF